MYLHRKAAQQPSRRSCNQKKKKRNSGRFRTDRCAHFGCYRPSCIVERHLCRSTKQTTRYLTRMAPRNSRIWKTGDKIATVALVPPFAVLWRCRWRISSSSQDQGNDPLGSTLRCCVKPKWILFQNEITEEYCNERVYWNLLSCCIVRRWAGLH